MGTRDFGTMFSPGTFSALPAEASLHKCRDILKRSKSNDFKASRRSCALWHSEKKQHRNHLILALLRSGKFLR